MLERNERKVTFDEVADDYEAIRPGYPQGAIDDVLRLAKMPEKGSIVEVGCGSGQATGSLTGSGHNILCLDISPHLLAIAEQKFAGYPNISFRQISFEEFQTEPGSIDLIIAASSWHWVDPEIGYRHAAHLLKSTGSLAVIATLHPKPFTGFFERVQEVYKKVVPEWGDPNSSRTTAGVIREAGKEMEESGLFTNVATIKHDWEVEYGRDDYLRLLTTYSDHFRLGPERLKELFEGIGRIIDEEYGGRVVRPYETIGFVGRKKGDVLPEIA